MVAQYALLFKKTKGTDYSTPVHPYIMSVQSFAVKNCLMT